MSRNLIFCCTIAIFGYADVALSSPQACYDAYWADNWQDAYANCATSAAEGDSEAQKNLGWLYDNGRGVAQNFNEAARWYTLAAKQGNSVAQGNLGFLYLQGKGVVQDFAEAAHLLRLAAEQGLVFHQRVLAKMYETGTGVLQDYAEAARWYSLAAEQGDSQAQYALGLLYSSGFGVDKNPVIAHMWLNIAASNGFNDAVDARRALSLELTSVETNEAQSLARICLESAYQDCGLEIKDENALGGNENSQIVEKNIFIAHEVLRDEGSSRVHSCWGYSTLENKGGQTVSVGVEGTAFDLNGHFIKSLTFNFNDVRPATISSKGYPAGSILCAEYGEVRLRVAYCFVNGERFDNDYCERRIIFTNRMPSVNYLFEGIENE